MVGIVYADCKGFYIDDEGNEREIFVERVVRPLGCKYGNCYWDGWKIKKGRKYCKIYSYGGGNTWARRGSLTERWSEENMTIETIDVFNKLYAIIENAINELKKLDEEEEDIDIREVEAQAILKKAYEKLVTEIQLVTGVDLLEI